MSKVRLITARVLHALVWAALVAAVAVIVVPRLLGWQLETVMSGSMVPALPVGSIIAVQPVQPAELATDDIITYQSGGNPPLTTHRIVEVVGDGTLITKGDANEDPDLAPVDDGAVIGRVEFFIPMAGYLAVLLKQPLGWGLVAAIAVFAWSVAELRKTRMADPEAQDVAEPAEQAAEQVAA